MPGDRYYSSGQQREDDLIVEREGELLEVRGPVTLPSQGRVHRSLNLQEASPFSEYYKILTSTNCSR